MKENTLMEMKETSRKINLRLEEGQLKKCLVNRKLFIHNNNRKNFKLLTFTLSLSLSLLTEFGNIDQATEKM